MLQVGFEPTIEVFEQAKTVHALDGAATVLGLQVDHRHKMYRSSTDCTA
jgi:hypothetical protein